MAAPALGLRLTLNGDYASLTLFLKKLELLPYYVDALSIAFSKNDNGEVKPASVRAGNTPSASRDLFQLPTNTPNASTPQGDQNHPVDFRPLRLILNVAIAVSK